MRVSPSDKIAVWFSCGAASAVALKLTVDKYGADRVVAVNNPVAEEDQDNLRFKEEVSRWVGVPIQEARNPRFPSSSAREVWEKTAFMSHPKGAPCTKFLKIAARQFWSENNPVDWHVLGFTADEESRYERFISSELSNVIPVLLMAGFNKSACFAMIQKAGISLPRVYLEGYPNANCIGCVKATSPTYWNHVRATRPEVFQDRAEMSRRLGARLVRVKNTRIFLDELSPDTKGRSMKGLDSECGVFCATDGVSWTRRDQVSPLEEWMIGELI